MKTDFVKLFGDLTMIYRWQFRQQLYFIASISIVFFIVVYILFSMGLSNQYRLQLENLHNAQALYTKRYAMSLAVVNLADRYLKLSNLQQQLNSIVPPESKKIDVVFQIDNLASKNKLIINNFNAESININNKGFSSQNIRLSVEGNYIDLFKFISDVSNNTQLLSINNISINGTSDNQVISSNMTITAYYLESNLLLN